ncbi:hypothetical protein LMG3431_02560 [Achromobacter pestifer]|uniref:Uncharacterized protein n=2 Tax=Achromobacter pestifer TaxID=1353889 RepID=A0A6S6YWI2_9BURK|nr:hypothetical protein LMG3431_02560 [Achromobacter pestifer]
MTDILTFPEYAHSEASVLNDEYGYDDPPDYPQFFSDRQRIYVKLGLKALTLAERLYEHAKIEPHDQGADMRVRLSERQAELETKRAEREERIAKHRANENDVFASSIASPPVLDQPQASKLLDLS